MYGDKQLDLESFKQAAKIRPSKGHLTAEGLEDIHSIKNNINRGRYSAV